MKEVTKSGRVGTPCDGLYGEAPPQRGTFFRLQVYEGVGISLVRVYKRGREICHWVCKRVQGLRDTLYGFKDSRKRSIFVIDSCSKNSAFTVI